MQWHQPIMDEGIKPKNFAWWFYVGVFLLSFLSYFIVMFFLNYGNNLKSPLDLILELFIIPLITAIACSLFIYNYYLSLKMNYQFRIQFIASKKRLWKNWIQQSLSLIDHSYLSPTENNAIKIIGLDGDAMPKAEQNLSIGNIDSQLDSRLNKILQSLLNSLVKKLQINSGVLEIDIYAPYLSEQLKAALMIFCRKNNLIINVDQQVNILSSIPDIEILDRWINEGKKEKLLILLSLHEQSRVTTSEFAVALLFRSHRSSDSEITTRVYRPLKSDLIKLSDDFSLLVNSEQMESKNLRHIWGVNMADSAMNTIITEVVENNLLIDVNNIHRLDLYEGKIDKAHGWLAIAYASNVIKHGQKGQLITLQIEDRVNLLQIEKTNKKQKNNLGDSIRNLPITYFVSVMLLLIALCFLPQDGDERKLLLLLVLGGGFFFGLLLSISMPLKRRFLIRKLEDEWMLLEGKNNE